MQLVNTILGYPLPSAREWVPLLVMALMVGAFESIFFRGSSWDGSRATVALI
jgi:hypothetical protein